MNCVSESIDIFSLEFGLRLRDPEDFMEVSNVEDGFITLFHLLFRREKTGKISFRNVRSYKEFSLAELLSLWYILQTLGIFHDKNKRRQLNNLRGGDDYR